MKKQSIWEKELPNHIKTNKTLNNLETDILIIGGGITGLTTAYYLLKSNKNITIITSNKVAPTTTSKTTAKISYLEQTIYSDLAKYHGLLTSKKYLHSQLDAIKKIKDIIKTNHIECDFIKTPSILFAKTPSGIKKVNKEKAILSSFKIKTTDTLNTQVPSGFMVKDTYTFNPLKYLEGLRKIIEKEIPIYETTMATSIIKKDKRYLVKTNNGSIYANKIILACHYPFFLIPNLFPLRTYIEREYVNAAKVKKPKNYSAINAEKQIHSIRYYQDYLIYGSNNHKLTSKIDYEKNYQQSIKDFTAYFHIKPTITWMNQDVMSHDKLPIIGAIEDNLYIATAYNKWGMTNATIAASILADLVNNKENKYQKIFAPNRINLPLIINSFISSFSYLKAYILALVKKNNPEIIKIKGTIYGIYKDKDNKIHKIKLICPHMKCPLVFNNEEKTWDCPCHGSRFDLDGKLIKGPSTKNITVNTKDDL